MDEKRVMFSVSEIKIMSAQHLLTEAGIESVTINKKDSAHAGIFGDIELYVDEAHSDRARAILQENGVI